MGRPSLGCNAAQLVLKYVLAHKKSLVSTWRSRIYYYSSATTFADVCGDIENFIDENPKGKRIIHRLKDVGLCHELVGDAIVAFIRRKPTFYKDAMLSKRHFWTVPVWKRAMTFVFMARFVTGKQGMCDLFKPYLSFMLIPPLIKATHINYL